ncbi:MAG: DUF438 domain-containing protein [Acidobacteriota bacterium]
MSELIDNRRHRLEALKAMIRELHDGAELQALKGRFRALLDQVGASEISVLESELMNEGMPEAEIRRMCDLHVAVFRDQLEQQAPAEAVPGHPVHTFRRDNEAITAALAEYRELVAAFPAPAGGPLDRETAERWRALHAHLGAIDAHYKRKEYLVFPFLEKAGITAPPKVMWGVDDDIRERLQAAGEAADSGEMLAGEELSLVRDVVIEPLLVAVAGMVEKEERVLWPMALKHLSEADWGAVQQQWDEFPPSLAAPAAPWSPSRSLLPERRVEVAAGDALALPSGALTAKQLIALLNTLPADLTFVDAGDRVAYFSEGRERVFARNRAILGRRVQDCHPPASMHIVQQVVDELRSGQRESAEFWITLQGKFIHIRYFAVRDEAGAYLGCLEVTQDVTAIRALEGERRLLAEVAPPAGRES